VQISAAEKGQTFPVTIVLAAGKLIFGPINRNVQLPGLQFGDAKSIFGAIY